MKRLDHLLTITGEEAVEVAQRASKALRFGLDEVQPGQPLSNRERLIVEINDLLAMVEMLEAEGVDMSAVGDDAALEAKKLKVENFLELSRFYGRLVD
jgi:hypothetical protein